MTPRSRSAALLLAASVAIAYTTTGCHSVATDTGVQPNVASSGSTTGTGSSGSGTSGTGTSGTGTSGTGTSGTGTSGTGTSGTGTSGSGSSGSSGTSTTSGGSGSSGSGTTSTGTSGTGTSGSGTSGTGTSGTGTTSTGTSTTGTGTTGTGTTGTGTSGTGTSGTGTTSTGTTSTGTTSTGTTGTSTSGTGTSSTGTSGTGTSGTGTSGTGTSGSGSSGTGSSGSGSTSGGTGLPSVVPANAIAVTDIQTRTNWKEAYDTGTSGSTTGQMSVVTLPSLSGAAREFQTTYQNYGGERYWASFGTDPNATNFFYDAWVYLANSASGVDTLELDMNQVISNGDTVIYGFQCDGNAHVWDYNENAGSPVQYTDHWVRSTQPCNVHNWTPNAWHHVQIWYSRNGSYVTYHSVWLDGKEQPINATVFSDFRLGWASVLLTNFQVDGQGTSGSSTSYVDKLTVYRW